MFNTLDFDKEVDDLILTEREAEAEAHMLSAYRNLKGTGEPGFGYVVLRLARFYSMPGTENLEKAESHFLEAEGLSPAADTKYETAMFYFYVAGDAERTISKVDEMRPSQTDRASYYSALTLKGQALTKLEKLHDAEGVLQDLVSLIETKPSGLPYGDELNFVEAALLTHVLAPKCCELLRLCVPRIRSREYRERGNFLLSNPPCSPELSAQSQGGLAPGPSL